MTNKYSFLLATAMMLFSGAAPAQEVQGQSVPYSEDFSTSDSADSFTVIDANDDGRTWSFNSSKKAMRYRGHNTNAANDWLATPAISFQAGKHYELSYTTFVLNNANGAQNMTTHLGTADDVTTFDLIAQNTDFNNEDKQTTSVMVAPTTTGNYRFAFHAVSEAGHGNFFIDDISVREVYAQDVTVALMGDERVKAGNKAEIVARVTNLGYESAQGYHVSLYANGTLVANLTGPAVEAGASTDLIYQYQTKVTDGDEVVIDASVIMDGDVDNANNQAKSLSVQLYQPSYPTVTELDAYPLNNGVYLEWAEVVPQNGPVTDSFEDYTPWVISGFGDWLTVDVDKARTMNLTDVSFPFMGKAMAYMTFVPEEVGFEDYYPAHSGKQCLYSFDAVEHDAPLGSDDWLISPELSGKAQTINFWHRAMYPTTFGEDKYEVLYSTTDRKVESFVKVGETIVSPGEWTEAQSTLPEGAKYFAIRCVSDPDEIAFMLDDVTYEPVELVVTGYNIYRGGQLIATVNASALSYTDVDGIAGEHEYQVSVVYNVGESILSEVATTIWSGVDNIHTADNGLMDVYSIDGRLVKRQTSSLQGLKGFYIVNGKKQILN